MIMNVQETKKATEVRIHWSEFYDAVSRGKPEVITRTRDSIFTSNIVTMKELLKVYTFTVNLFNEDDGTVTASLKELDIVVNGDNEEDVITLLVDDIIEYSKEFYAEFSYWSSAPNRKAHAPYILNVLMQDNIDGVKALIKCQPGEI